MALSGSISTPVYYDPEDHDSHVLTFSWTATQSVENNTSTINWTLSYTTSYAYYTYISKLSVNIDGANVYSRPDRTATYGGTITTGTVVLTHNNAGDRSFTASIQAGIYDHAVNRSATGTWDLNNIPRASTVAAAATMYFGQSGTLNITRADNTFTDGVHWHLGSQWGSIVADESPTSASSVTWTPPTSLMNEIPNNTSAAVEIITHTFNSGGTLIATRTSLVTVNVPASVKPTASVSRSIVGSTFGVYAQGISKCNVVTTASGAYGSTISSIVTTCEGVSYSGDDITTNTLTGSGSIAVKTVVKDSRGRSATVNGSITVSAYSTPTISFSVHRCDSGGTADEMGSYANVYIHGTGTAIGSGADANVVTVSLKMRQVGQSTWTDVTVTPTGTAVDKEVDEVIAASDTSSWEFMATVADKTATILQTVQISVGYATIDFLAGGRGIAFGTTALTAGFKCAMDADFTGAVKLGGLIIKAGTKTFTPAQSTDVQLFTWAELDTLFGTSDSDEEHVAVFAYNGDISADTSGGNKIIDGTYNDSSGVIIHSNIAWNGVGIRVNYIAVHF